MEFSLNDAAGFPLIYLSLTLSRSSIRRDPDSVRLNLTKGDVITKLNIPRHRLWCDGPGVISRHPVSHSLLGLYYRHLFSALIALPPSGVVIV